MKKLTTNDFIAKAQQKHNYKFEYNKVNYVNYKTKVCIVCSKHGDFWQTPSNHLKYGCCKCQYETLGIAQLKDAKTFKQDAAGIHGEKYNYDFVEYKGSHKKICILCQKHGVFWQTPRSHLNGRGCPKCRPPVFCSYYFGKYKGSIFRSLSELFWMIEKEREGKLFVSIDQGDKRKKWMVNVYNEEKISTYCADFFIPEDNLIIDIKPKWRANKDAQKLHQAKIAYNSIGFEFKVIDCNEIKIDKNILKSLVENQTVWFYPASAKKISL